MAPIIPQPPPALPIHDQYHRLLSTRYVCRNCLTRYFTPNRWCRACRQWHCIVPLDPALADRAKSDTELRKLMTTQTP